MQLLISTLLVKYLNSSQRWDIALLEHMHQVKFYKLSDKKAGDLVS